MPIRKKGTKFKIEGAARYIQHQGRSTKEITSYKGEEEGAEMEEMSETGVTGKEARTVFMIEHHGLDGVGYWVCNRDGIFKKADA